MVPGSAGFVRKVFSKVNPETMRSSLATLLVTALVLTVADTAEVVAVIGPGVAPDGTSIATENVQLSPGVSEPPVRVRVVVPLKVDPLPQMSFCVLAEDAKPASAAFKSSVHPIPVASPVALAL